MVDASVLSQWIVNVGRRDARARIAHLICEMAVRLHAAPAQGEVTFPFGVTQTQLADATGLTGVHVNRTLQALRHEGIAHVSSRAVHIPDWEALAETGDFDAGYLQIGVKPQARLRIVGAA